MQNKKLISDFRLNYELYSFHGTLSIGCKLFSQANKIEIQKSKIFKYL